MAPRPQRVTVILPPSPPSRKRGITLINSPSIPVKNTPNASAPSPMVGHADFAVPAIERFITLNFVWPYAGAPTSTADAIVASPPTVISWL